MTPPAPRLARRLVHAGRRAAGRVVRVVGRALPVGSGALERALVDSGLFDPAYYLAANPDVAAAGVDPVAHYLRHGAREGRDPHPLFDTSYYVATNPDVAATGVNPLAHYLRHGAREGRDPHPLFDTSYYLATNPEVAATGVNPLAHYLRQGAREGRKPHALVVASALGAAVEAGLVPKSPPLEFVPVHVLEWRDGPAVLGRRVADDLGALEGRPLRVGASIEFSLVVPGDRLEQCRLQLGPVTGPVTDLEVQGRLETWPEPREAFRAVVPLGRRDEAGWLRIDLRACPAAAGRRLRLRLTPRGGAEGAVVLPGAPAFTGQVAGQGLFLRAAGREAAPPAPAADRRPLTVVLGPDGGDGAAAQALLVRRFPEVRPHFVLFDSATRLWPILRASEVVMFVSPWAVPADLAGGFDELAFALHQAGVVTVFWDATRHVVPTSLPGASADPAIRRLQRARVELARRCHFAVTPGPEGTATWSAAAGALPPARLAEAGLADLRAWALEARRPRVAIVSILYRKADVVERFLDMVCRQSYDGPITVILVDDCSPDDGVARAEAYRRRRPDWPGHVELRILHNRENLGNCASRNRGLAAVEADVYVVIDCDCLMNRDFVLAHVEEHALPPTGVVCGPLNIESGDRDPVELVRQLEADPDAVLREARLQDDVQPDGFVNLITRNFSVQRRHLPPEGLFDEAFAYSARPGSGFGWEDVEMGYRLYRAGVPAAFTDRAFAVHASHPSSIPEARQCVGSARNFDLLFTKHPDLALAARRWAAETAGRIEAWAGQLGVADDPAVARVRERFAAPRERLGPYLRARHGGRRLRLLTYRWHVAHQYELQKLPHDFTLVTGLGERMTDVWSYDQRPLRPNVRLLPAELVRESEYDAAILHFDENALSPDLARGVLGPEWGAAFRHFLREVRLPKVAICHGTPQFVGQYATVRTPIERWTVHEGERGWLVEALRGVQVIVNSWQALDEWGFEKARVIWHGFDPQEFPPATRERQVLSHGDDWWRPHYRGAHAFRVVRDLLGDETRLEGADHPGAVLRPRLGNAFARANFRAYVDWIRSFTVYLNTTLRSPMPRSRGEAMMCGVLPVTLANHDVEHFIRHGVDGFYGRSPEELAEYVRYVLRHPDQARRLGEAARRKALDVFNHDRYLAEWTAVLAEVAG